MTGAKGMLGTDVCAVLSKDHEVIGFDIDDFDIVDPDAVKGAITSVSPDVIIHLAAFTNVEACETECQSAFNTNAIGTLNVAKAAREAGSLLVYVSTDYVFDGKKTSPYIETDTPNPINFYGITKLYGEEYVKSLCVKHLILRTSWLFGANGRNFVDTILSKARRGESLRVIDDQRGCPTYTLHLAYGIEQAIGRKLEGIVHLTSSGEATWYELAVRTLEEAGIRCEIQPVATQEYPAKARRPHYSVLGSLIVRYAGLDPLPHWIEGLRDHLSRTAN